MSDDIKKLIEIIQVTGSNHLVSMKSMMEMLDMDNLNEFLEDMDTDKNHMEQEVNRISDQLFKDDFFLITNTCPLCRKGGCHVYSFLLPIYRTIGVPSALGTLIVVKANYNMEMYYEDILILEYEDRPNFITRNFFAKEEEKSTFRMQNTGLTEAINGLFGETCNISNEELASHLVMLHHE